MTFITIIICFDFKYFEARMIKLTISWILRQSCKVWDFWEGHKIWKNLCPTFDKFIVFCTHSSVLVKKSTKILQMWTSRIIQTLMKLVIFFNFLYEFYFDNPSLPCELTSEPADSYYDCYTSSRHHGANPNHIGRGIVNW